MHRNFNKFLLLLIALVLAAVGFLVFQKFKSASDNIYSGKDNPFNQRYSDGKCEGEGTVTFAYSPLRVEDIGQIEPYGIMVDAHVIPTSHGYFSPIVFNSPPDAYPVYAIADGVIVNVSHRDQAVGDNSKGQTTEDYQMYFEHSCTFYTYYDLLTSISPEIEAQVGKLTGFENKRVRIPVKAGQMVGRIGGRTVDFAVWNFEKEPAYFANPKSYEGDEDRFYLDDMFFYFQEPLRSQLLAKNLRVVEPRTGQVAYDKPEKMVGNWFKSGSGGFMGPKETQGAVGRRYWDGHLAIVYDFIDPTKIIFSIGDFNGTSAQFSVVGNSPDPAIVGAESGLVKYELLSRAAQDSPDGVFKGTVILQLLDEERLKLELFPGQRANDVNNFTQNALIYER